MGVLQSETTGITQNRGVYTSNPITLQVTRYTNPLQLLVFTKQCDIRTIPVFVFTFTVFENPNETFAVWCCLTLVLRAGACCSSPIQGLGAAAAAAGGRAALGGRRHDISSLPVRGARVQVRRVWCRKLSSRT